MASLFDFLFDSLPMAVAHHGAHMATPGEWRTSVREGIRRARLGALRQQMMRFTTVRPPILRSVGLNPDVLGERLWSLNIGTDLSSVGRGTCRVRDQHYDEMVVFERIRWGREVGQGIEPSVLVEDLLGNKHELPLSPDFLLDEWFVFSDAHVPQDAIAMFPLETRPDIGLVRVFMYELDVESLTIVPLDPATFDIRDQEAFDRYKRAAASLDSSVIAPADLDAPTGEELSAFEPFFTLEELSLSGTIGADEMVRFTLQRPRFIVATSLMLCKESTDFEPGGIVGFAKFHPSMLVTSSTTVRRIEAAVRIDRPARSTNLSVPGRCSCEEMGDEIRSLLVTDANAAEMLYPAAAPPPYWGNLFSYYRVDPHVSDPGRRWAMVRPLVAARNATGYVERWGPAPGLDLKSDLTSKVAGQGDFDNVHLAPRMHLRDASHVSRETRISSIPFRTTDWRQIGPADRLELDPIVMAPICAHDCMHHHVRWGDHATARHALGWARNPALLKEAAAFQQASFPSPSLLQACAARTQRPSTEAGASMYPPWQQVGLRLEAHAAQLSTATLVPTLPGQREVLFHSPWAYGVHFADFYKLAFGISTTLGKLGREQFVLGTWTSGGIVPIVPGESFAALYWVLRYRSVAYEDGTYASHEYHVAHDLEKAIVL